MGALADHFADSGLPAWLGFTRSFLLLIGPQGALLKWNPAFETYQTLLPAAHTLEDVFVFADSILDETRQASHPRQLNLELAGSQTGRQFNCLLIPLPNGNFLLCAEEVDETQPLAVELHKVRSALDLKTIELESVLAQVDEIAHTDPLTYIANRRQIVGDLQRAVAHSERFHEPLTIFMADIDHFKQVNDTYGHQAGDEVLRVLSSQLRDSIRLADTIGRYGGEEFLLLLPGTTQAASLELANRLLEKARGLEVIFNGQAIKVTISLGIAQYCPGDETWEGILQRADRALYESKNTGRNRWSAARQRCKGE